MSFYDVLGVDEQAGEGEIKKVYKRLARQYHPDVNPNDPTAEAKFKEISAAYAVLGDEDKRRNYDQELHRQKFGPAPGHNFEAFFREVGSPLHIAARIQLSFLEAKERQVKTIKYNKKVPCTLCKGSGAKSYHKSACGACHGRGNITRVFGAFHATQICMPCGGKGKQIKDLCSCDEGSVLEAAEIKVNIPAGILSGKTLRLAGEGNKSATGRGDFRLHIEVLPDPRWVREGANVLSAIDIPYHTLMLGGEVEVETIWGKEMIKIPARTKTGVRKALYGKGFPRLGSISDSEKGIHYLLVNLKIPENLSSKHLALLQKLKDLNEA